MPTETPQALQRTDRWQDEARRVAKGIRRRVLTHTIKHNGGYLSQACSSAEILATLYTGLMKLGPSQGPPIPPPFQGPPGPHNLHSFRGAPYNGPAAPDLDRLFFSPAHYALVLYATLIEVGRLAPEALDQFNQDGSTLEMIGAEHSPGMETTSGSLSQALSQAGGVALARRLRREPGRVWVFLSDGELQEGQTWEAFAALAFYKLDNVAIYIDVNGQQCDGRMEHVMTIEPARERLAAFGARVFEVDGHDPDALAAPALTQEPGDGRPLAVLARTDPCLGIDLLRTRTPKLHYLRFKNDDERRQYQDLLASLQQEGATHA
jgi:transketolase